MSNNPKAINQKKQMIALEHMNLSMIFSENGKVKDAEQHFLKSYEIYKNRKKYPLLPKRDEIILLSGMGRFYLSQKNMRRQLLMPRMPKKWRITIQLPI